MTTNNMYRVGDFVYFETSVSHPYQIRKIEELNKTPQGAVEAKAICYYRRRDISKTLIQQAERHRFIEDEDYFEEDPNSTSPKLQHTKVTEISNESGGYFKDSHVLTSVQSHQAKHRELFLSRQVETLPATHIRGKCNVTLYNDAESIFDYLNKDDTFFYKFTYDPSQKTLHADRNAIRVGSDFQTHVKPYRDKEEKRERDEGELIYSFDLKVNDDLNQFVLICRSLGTLGRAYDPHSLAQHPELLFAASSASRDVTLQRAHDIWFKSLKDLPSAISLILPDGCPKIFKDELEQWTPQEHSLFLQGMEKHGKDFYTLKNELLPWKTLKSVIEYYYMWKSTDKYWLAKRQKISSQTDHKLKQVYIPSFLKPNPAVLCTKPLDSNSNGCESCLANKSSQWYVWGTASRLCANCWGYWKRFGGLRNPSSRDFSLENPTESNNIVSNGDNTENLNQVGSFKCNQPNCDKEFRVKAQLHRHLHNTHGINQNNIVNGSWDILNQYSKSANNTSNLNHLFSLPGGRGMVKPRTTAVFKVNLRFRCGRVLLSKYINPKRIARNHASLNSSNLESLFQKIEKIPLQNFSKDCLKRLFKFSKSFKPIGSVIDNIWKRKNLLDNLKVPSYLKPLKDVKSCNLTSNGIHKEPRENPNKCAINGVIDEAEPLPKVRKIADTSLNVNINEKCSGKDLTEKSESQNMTHSS